MASKSENIAAISLENIKVDQDPKAKQTDFTNVPLEVEGQKQKRLVLKDPNDPKFENKKNKMPHKTLHFSDGVLEEYSETEDEEDETDKPPEIDPKTLAWLPWVWHHLTRFGGKSLYVADMCGEKLAWMFGITSPKYQHAIDEYYRMKKEEEEEAARESRELEAERQRRLQATGGINPVDMEGGNNNQPADHPSSKQGIYNKGFLLDNELTLLSHDGKEKVKGSQGGEIGEALVQKKF